MSWVCGCSANRSGTGSVAARVLDLAELLEQAAACPLPTTVFDTDDTAFQTPGRHARPHWRVVHPNGACLPPLPRRRRRGPSWRASPPPSLDSVEAASALSGTPGDNGARRRRGRSEPATLPKRSPTGSASRARRPRRGHRTRQRADPGTHARTPFTGDLESLRANVTGSALVARYTPAPARHRVPDHS